MKMSNLKKVLAGTLALAMAIVFAGCGGSSSKGSTSGSQSPTGVKKVAILTPYLSSVTTKQMADSLESGLKKNNVDVTVVDTKGDFSQLASRIEDVVSTKVDAIVLVSADPNQVKSQLQEAFKANIPVFGCDSGYIDGMMVNATSDNHAMGEQMAKYLFEDLMGKKGTVIALTYRPHPGVVKRCVAFDEAIKKYPNIKLITEQQVGVPGPIENSRKIMENLILANSKKDSITAVWAAWDEPAIGATQALQAAGRNEVIVTGVDGNSQAIELIQKGTNLKATLAQNFDGMAKIVVDDINDMFAGKTVTKGEKYAPATLVTKENAASFASSTSSTATSGK